MFIRSRVRLILLAAAIACPGADVMAQSLRFSNHRELKEPDYATLRLGSFYSSWVWSESAGYRYSKSSGSGTESVVQNRRGQIFGDGDEYPVVSSLNLKNYVLISRKLDMDISILATYEYYPMDTQADAFYLDVADEGISGDISMEFELGPFIKATLKDLVSYRTDYVDLRGVADAFGGQRYVHFNNSIGIDLDWLMKKDMNMAVSAARADNIPMEKTLVEQESVSYSESLGIQKKFGPLVVGGISADFGQVQYPATNREDSAYQSYMATVVIALTKKTVLKGGAGYGRGELEPSGDFVSTNAAEAEASDSIGSFVGNVEIETKLGPGLSHSLNYSRSMQPGFQSSFDVNDSARYSLRYDARDMKVSFNSSFSTLDPGNESLGRYSDLMNEVTFTRQVSRPLTLEFRGMYSARDNGDVPAVEGTPAEIVNDYETWSARGGFTLVLVRRKYDSLALASYYEHIERLSDFEELAYSRDIVSALLTFTHEF